MSGMIPEVYLNVYIGFLRYAAPILVILLLFRCFRPLLTFRKEPEIWAWLMLEDGKISGLIDLAQSGAADRWYDITLMLQSLERNFSGFFGGRSYPGFERGMFFSALGLKEDKEKTEYFLMLDELFSV